MNCLFHSLLLLTCLSGVLSTGCREESKTCDEDSQPDGPRRAGEAVLTDVQAVARGNNAFAFDLHRQLGGSGNLFFSPLSITTALSMTYAGARGDTAGEMARTLRYPFEGERLHLGYAGLLGKLSGADKPAGVELKVANSLWGPYDYVEDFLTINRDCYAAHLRKIKLVGAEPTINKWVEEQTAERIKDLLPPNKLDPDSVLVLVNAVYFKGDWKHQFKELATRVEQFRVKPGRTVQAKMMHQTGEFRHARTDDGQVLELPYKGGDLSMVLILPKSDDGLGKVEKTVTAEKLDQWLQSAQTKKVQLSMPRFKMAGDTITLRPELIKLGMARAFAGGADFSGMCAIPVWIADVLHKSFVEVNEEGSEAAAATAVIMAKDGGGPRDEPIVFTADHPFLFMIRDTRTGCILFLGRLSDPTKE